MFLTHLSFVQVVAVVVELVCIVTLDVMLAFFFGQPLL